MPIVFFRTVDRYIIGLFILILFPLKYIFCHKKNKIIKHPKKVLIIRLWALGSSLLTFPTIQQLKNHYGNNVQYDLIATSRNIGIFKNQGYFDKKYNLFKIKDVLNLILKFKKYDIVIDAEEYFMVSAFLSMWTGKINVGYNNIFVRGMAYNNSIKYNDKQHSLITTLDLIKKIGINYTIPEYMEPLKYTEQNKIKVDGFLSGFKGKLICMHTGGAETAKERARPQKKWKQLIENIIDKYPNTFVFLSGTDFEKDIVQNIINKLTSQYQKNVINICGIFNLFEFSYFLEKCDLMVSNDTGPMHLAAAMKVKTIGLFGPELPSKFGPYPLDKNIGLYKGAGEAFIKVHLAQWKRDKDYSIDKIVVEDVLNGFKKYID